MGPCGSREPDKPKREEMRAAVEFFIKRSRFVDLITVALILASLVAVLKLRRNAYPQVDGGHLYITTEYLGASPEDVEQNVTRLIEEELDAVSGVKRYISISAENASRIVVDIDLDSSDLENIKDEVKKAVDRVTEFPVGVTKRPNVTEGKTGEIPTVTVTLSGDVPYADLREAARILKKDLHELAGVSQVQEYGYRDHQFQVNVNPDKLEEYYLSISDILMALKKRNIRSTGGSLESYRTELNIITFSQFENVEQVKDVIVRSAYAGGSVSIKDVAEVHEGFEDEKLRPRFNGESGIVLIVKKRHEADVIRLVNRINNHLDEFQQQVPQGIKLDTVDDMSLNVRHRMKTLASNALVGFIIVFILLSLFLNIRFSIWVAAGVPIALGIALILFPVFDADLNALTLAGLILVLGLIVDDSIVISENVFRHRAKNPDAVQATIDGVIEIGRPVLATIITTLCSFVPMLYMTGVLGQLLYYLPVVVIIAMIGSSLECFFILPNHLSRTKLPKKTATVDRRSAVFRRVKVYRWINIAYRKTLIGVLRARYAVATFFIVLLVFSLWWGVAKVGINLFPTDGAFQFNVYVEMHEGQTFDATEGVVQQVEQAIDELPEDELEFYSAMIGASQPDPVRKLIGGQENIAFIRVTTKVSGIARSLNVVIDELRAKTDKITEAKSIRYETLKEGPRGKKPVEFYLISNERSLRSQMVDQILADLHQMVGVSDISTSKRELRDEYRLDFDYKQLANLGLTVSDVSEAIRAAFDGIEITSVVRKNEEIGVQVRFDKAVRKSPHHISSLSIRNQQGQLIHFSSFARVEKAQSYSEVLHYNGDVATAVYAQVDESKILPVKVIKTIQEKYGTMIDNNPDLRFAYEGEAKETHESLGSIAIAFACGLGIIYIVLVLLFDSYIQPFLVLMAVPFGLIGVVWAFELHGEVFSFVALVGVVGLSGVLVNDSLIMIDYLNQRFRETGIVRPSRCLDIIADAALVRLRPIMVTSLTTVAGLAPLAYGVGGHDVWLRPLALSMLWGLIFATFITLFLIPCLYVMNGGLTYLVNRALGKAPPESTS